jgi:dihydroorotate dehydrogenase
MYSIIKFFLFRRDPEVIHYWVMRKLKYWCGKPVIRALLKKECSVNIPSLEKTLWGLQFKNPVGLAAGFDKDAKYIDELACLGFGFIEIGTLTPRAQPGNEQPRLFRLPKDKALINRMGFNNEGVKAAVERLKKRESNIIIGGNIGKNKTTPNDKAMEDYETCFRELYDYVDYFTVNVSSPNTPNLRALQGKEPLQKLLAGLQALNAALGKAKPVLLKIAPDLSREQLDDIIEIANQTKIQGIVATNTTISRAGLETGEKEVAQMGAGGLSGLPVRERSTDVIRYIHQKTNGTLPIIAAGGIFTAADAKEKLDAGASLVQIYTGFIYEGPMIVKHICKKL